MHRNPVHIVCLAAVLAWALSSCGTARQGLDAPQEETQTLLPDSLTRAETPVDTTFVAQKDSLSVGTPLLGTPAREEVPPVAAQVPQENLEDLPLADQVIAYARTFTGTPYRLGATGPREFDCSSFTSYVFRHFGYTITPFSQAQFREGREVERYSELQKGDLVFFGKRAGVRDIGHVGIVVSIDEEQGSFTFIHASVSKGVTEETSNHPYFMMRYVGARRILPDE